MKTFSQYMNEGTDLRCQKCGDNLGKNTENSKKAYCGTCGATTPNPAGSDESHVGVKAVTRNHPNIKLTKHKFDAKPSGKAFTVAKSGDGHYVSHGNGVYTVTTPYKDHAEYSHLGVNVARTSINKLSSDGHKFEIGSIDHTKHPDGSETHSLTYRPSNHTWSGGEVKSLKDAVAKTHEMHNLHLKKTGYYKEQEQDHGHDVKFKDK